MLSVYRLFHAFKAFILKLAIRSYALCLYILDYKLILYSLLFLFSYLVGLLVLRNVTRPYTIGAVLLIFVISFLIVLLVFVSFSNMPNSSMFFKSKLWSREFVYKIRGIGFAFIVGVLAVVYALVTCRYEREQNEAVGGFTLGNTGFVGFVLSEPSKGHILQSVETRALWGGTRSDTNWDKYEGNILVRSNPFQTFNIGQRCFFYGNFVEPKNFSDFDYKKYLRGQSIYIIFEAISVECDSVSDVRYGFVIRNFLVDLKYYLISKVDTVLFEPQSSLLVGILFGQERLFSKNFEKAVRDSGVSHIVAASGYNVSILIVFANRTFSFLERKSKNIIGLVVIWMFAMLSGLSASIVRACIMTSVSLIAVLFGRSNSIHIAIPFTVAIFLIFDRYILESVGLQLSLMATLGLVYLLPVFENVANSCFGKSDFLKGYVLPTMSCTIATMPVTLSVFNSFSVWSVLANTLILPVIEGTMLWGVLAIISQKLLPQLSYLFFSVVNIQLKYFEWVVEHIGGINWGVWSIDSHYAGCLSVLLGSIVFIFVIYFYPLENEKYNYYIKSATLVCKRKFS